MPHRIQVGRRPLQSVRPRFRQSQVRVGTPDRTFRVKLTQRVDALRIRYFLIDVADALLLSDRILRNHSFGGLFAGRHFGVGVAIPDRRNLVVQPETGGFGSGFGRRHYLVQTAKLALLHVDDHVDPVGAVHLARILAAARREAHVVQVFSRIGRSERVPLVVLVGEGRVVLVVFVHEVTQSVQVERRRGSPVEQPFDIFYRFVVAQLRFFRFYRYCRI